MLKLFLKCRVCSMQWDLKICRPHFKNKILIQDKCREFFINNPSVKSFRNQGRLSKSSFKGKVWCDAVFNSSMTQPQLRNTN